jgi:allantoinase
MQPRDYGPFPYIPIKDRPKLEWPGGARVAVWVIPNIEFFHQGHFGPTRRATR